MYQNHNHPYPTYVGYQQGYVVYAEQSNGYPAYEPNRGPTRAYAPSFQTPPQVLSNPFLPAPGQSNPVISNSKKWNNRKKRQQLTLPAVPRVPQPMGNTVHNGGATLNAAPNTDPSPQQLAPPGQQWILVANPATASASMQLPTVQIPEPAKPIDIVSQGEPEKPSSQERRKEDLMAAQTAADKLQWIIKSSLACLLEPRLKYPLSRIGIIDALLPQRKIETICGVSAIGSVLIAGISYLQIHGLPSSSLEKLLGQCKTLKLIQFCEGALEDMADLSTIDPETQDRKVKDYKMIHQYTIAGFLQHFSGIDTFCRKPEVCVREGILPCSL